MRWPSFTRGVHGRFKFNFHQEANSMTETGPFSPALSFLVFALFRLSPIPPCLSTIRFTLSSIRVRFFLLFFLGLGLSWCMCVCYYHRTPCPECIDFVKYNRPSEYILTFTRITTRRLTHSHIPYSLITFIMLFY